MRHTVQMHKGGMRNMELWESSQKREESWKSASPRERRLRQDYCINR